MSASHAVTKVKVRKGTAMSVLKPEVYVKSYGSESRTFCANMTLDSGVWVSVLYAYGVPHVMRVVTPDGVNRYYYSTNSCYSSSSYTAMRKFVDGIRVFTEGGSHWEEWLTHRRKSEVFIRSYPTAYSWVMERPTGYGQKAQEKFWDYMNKNGNQLPADMLNEVKNRLCLL